MKKLQEKGVKMSEALEELKNLVGKKVIDVKWFQNGAFDEGFILFFEDNFYLTAQDGEYGDNAFEFLDLEEVREKLRDNGKN